MVDDGIDSLLSIPAVDLIDVCSSLLDFNRSLEVNHSCDAMGGDLVDIDLVERVRADNDS